MSISEGRNVKLVPALDFVELDRAAELARALGGVPWVYGFKVGFALALTHGLARVVRQLRVFTRKPIIYDHQKGGTDIPDTGALFASTLRKAGVDEAILFPQAGPETLCAWAKALADVGIKVIVGGVMTHPGYLQSERGYIADDAAVSIYKTAAGLGVRAFVVPLTRPDAAKLAFDAAGSHPACEFYSPGLGAQGGDPAQFGFLKNHYLIAGRSLAQAPDPVKYVEELFR